MELNQAQWACVCTQERDDSEVRCGRPGYRPAERLSGKERERDAVVNDDDWSRIEGERGEWMEVGRTGDVRVNGW